MKKNKLVILITFTFMIFFSHLAKAGCWYEKNKHCIFGKCTTTSVKLCNWESQPEDAPILTPVVEAIDYANDTLTNLFGLCADSHLDRMFRLANVSGINDNEIRDVHEVASEKKAAYEGNKVYFVNGVFNDLSSAKESAKKLSDVVTDGPVNLIFNPSSVFNQGYTGTPTSALNAEGAGIVIGFGDIVPSDWVDVTGYAITSITNDIKESIYDRYWVNRSPNGCHQQHNPTTIKLTKILYDHASNNDSGVTVVSHSQGTLIVRNAIRALKELGAANWVKHNLTWVLAGSPLNQAEQDAIKIPGMVVLSLSNPEDCVATLIKDGRGGTCDMTEHAFIEGYIHKLHRYKPIITKNYAIINDANQGYITKNDIDSNIDIITTYNDILELYHFVWNRYPSEQEIGEDLALLESGTKFEEIQIRELNKKNATIMISVLSLLNGYSY